MALTHDFRSYPVFRNGESALEMRYPDPPLELSVGPAELPAGSEWELTVTYSGENLVTEKPAFRRSAWKPGWNAPERPLPVTVTLSGIDGNGRRITEPRNCTWQGSPKKAEQKFRFRMAHALRSPAVRLQTKPAEGSTLWIHAVTLAPAAEGDVKQR